MESSYNSPTTKPIYKATQIIWYVVGLVEALIAVRFVLKLLGANPGAGFTRFVYDITRVMVGPFLSVFGVTQVQGSVFEWPTLLTMLVYWFVALALVKLFLLSKTVSTPEAAEKLNKPDCQCRSHPNR